jgi:uncharacterized protein (TIGR02231 family)
MCASLAAMAGAEEKEVASTVKEAIVFRQGAQVTREAKAAIPAGSTVLKFTGIAPNIDKQSIQVSATGDFTILSVNHQTNFFQELEETQETRRLKTELEGLQAKLNTEQAMLQVFNEEESMILANKAIGGQQSGVKIEDLKAAADFYRTRLAEIKTQKLEIAQRVKVLQENIQKIQNQLNEISAKRKPSPTSEILVAVSAAKAVQGSFRISYLVGAAGWFPIYDLRVTEIDRPAGLAYKANVYQSSGEEWKGVQLSLSTGNPSESGTRPELHPWWLRFYQPIAARQRMNQKEKDMDGRLLMETAPSAGYAEARDDVAAGGPSVMQVDNATTVEFRIEQPYDIPSDGKQYVVNVGELELPATYEYYAAPKLDKDAFLTALVTDWEQFNLLSGEVNLFFEGTYLGKSFLDVQSVEDTLRFSLGRDKGVVVTRTKQKQFTERQFIGNKKTEMVGWEIEVRNKKKQPIRIVVEDQYPLTTTDEIEVALDNAKGAEVNADTGQLRWTLDLKSGQAEKLAFRYSVRYPKKGVVALE